MALRVWTSQAAKDLNNREGFSDPALLALETAKFSPLLPQLFADDAAAVVRYTGPLPMTPVAVTAVSPTERQKPLTVGPIVVTMVLDDGSWKVDATGNSTSFPCTKVTVPMPTW